MIVDAHHHYWKPARGDYGWLERGSPLDRDWLPADLDPWLAECGVEGTILVQAAPTLAETEYLLGFAASDPAVLGVIGWVDLDTPDVADLLKGARARGIVGIRPMLQDLPDPEWICGAGRFAGLSALSRSELAFDALVRPRGMPAIAWLADRFPSLTVVLDHGGKPPLGDADAMLEWEAQLRELARRPNVLCKLSGLLTEAPENGRESLVKDAMARMIDIWTPQRMIWGSDWPVLTLAGDYQSWFALARQALRGLSDEENEAVFGGNARRAYGL